MFIKSDLVLSYRIKNSILSIRMKKKVEHKPSKFYYLWPKCLQTYFLLIGHDLGVAGFFRNWFEFWVIHVIVVRNRKFPYTDWSSLMVNR